jgi:hypothetical protein
MINRIFGPLLDMCLIAYIDDIIVFSKTKEDHYTHLKWFFERLTTNELFLKLIKCEFLKEEVEFCGHVVGKDGFKMSPDKVKAMQARPAIKGPADIRSYLDSCVWFSAFIPDYARIVTPLTNLTRKNTAWKWGAEQEEAISLLILLITTAPTLKHFNVTLPTEIFTDASAYAIGGWLGQRYTDGLHPVFFWSR